jgi:D-inositol-3-phosphate glycosyltransferase
MLINENSRLALISVSGDPAVEIGKEEAGGQNVYVRQVGLALAKQGWSVDMFTRRIDPAQATIVQHAPNCRTIRLTAGPATFIGRDNVFSYLPEFVKQFQAFQEQEGYQYPLVHTNYWLSSWVGMQLKKLQSSKQVHTYHSLGAVKYRTVKELPAIATTRLEVEQACLETADRIIATSPQEEEHMRTLVSQKGAVEIVPCGTDVERLYSIRR